jgi:hypothetical protein
MALPQAGIITSCIHSTCAIWLIRLLDASVLPNTVWPLDPPCQCVIMFTCHVCFPWLCMLVDICKSVDLSTCVVSLCDCSRCCPGNGSATIPNLCLVISSCHNMVLCLIGSCNALRLDNEFDLYSSKYGFHCSIHRIFFSSKQPDSNQDIGIYL